MQSNNKQDNIQKTQQKTLNKQETQEMQKRQEEDTKSGLDLPLDPTESIMASASTGEAGEDRRPQFFGRRKGKRIRPAREALFDALLPKLLLTLPSNPADKLDIDSLYPFSPTQRWLEIGFGGGEHLAQQSLLHKDVAFIGAEVFVNGVASLVAHLAGAHNNGNMVDKGTLASGRQDNVRIFNDDVRLLFASLSDNCMDRIYVLFPDPWPKKKHALRRFIGPDNIPTLARLLKKGGILRVASDDMNYIRWSLEHLCACPDFSWSARSADDWRCPPCDWCNTRYELKAIEAGRKPIYLTFIKE